MVEPGCATCKYYRGGMSCEAYPKVIPFPILSGDVPHFQSIPGHGAVPGDQGITYEEADDDELRRRGEIA